MLNGIGGPTIEIAKETLTVAEVRRWQLYFAKRGTGNAGLRTEALMAQLLSRVWNATGGNTKPADFAPHLRSDAEDEVLEDTPENLALLMRGTR